MTLVSESMSRPPIETVSSSATAEEAARKMKSANKGCLVVMKGEVPIGMVTERDLVQRVVAPGTQAGRVKVSEVMSSPLVAVGPAVRLEEAARVMVDHRIRRLVVLDGTKVVGILTVTDFARHLEHKNGPLAQAMTRGRLVLSEARNLRRQCPKCGSRTHIELLRATPVETVPGSGEVEAISIAEAGSQAGTIPGPVTSERRGRIVVERSEDTFRCRQCGREWKEETEADFLVPEGIPADVVPTGGL